MAKLIMDKELKQQLNEAFRRLDNELKEIYEMADRELRVIEKRIERLRRTHRA